MRFARLLLPLLLAVPGRAEVFQHRYYISPQEIRDYDTRKLAELLVERIHLECDLPETPTPGDKVLAGDARLIMMVPARLFDAISRHGFENQHQTKTTGGHWRESDRFEAEQELAMLRLPFDERGVELLPKYAVLDVKRPDLGTYRLPTQYGDVAVVFKKEVADRATWTYADSLDFSQKSGRFNAGGAGNPVLPHTFEYLRKSKDANRCGNYCEAQIWGKLTFADVDFVMIPSSEPTPSALASFKIPAYDYAVASGTASVVDPARTAQYVRGGLRHDRDVDRRHRIVDWRRRPISDATLIKAIHDSSSQPDRLGGFSPRERLIAELAALRKSSATVAALESIFAKGGDQTRALALYGLTELAWPDFKPWLLESLDAAPGPLLINAVAFAADHRDDPDVAARLARLRRAPESVATEWLERLDKTKLCSPR